MKRMKNSPQERLSLTPLYRGTIIISILWTLIILGSLSWDMLNTQKHTRNLAQNTARANFNKDLAIRQWAAARGGLYAPIDNDISPSPYLKHLPERDIETPSGTQLTLISPAYMLRQLMTQYAELYGIQGRITSLRPLNSLNAPDQWERAALAAFQQGTEEIFQFTDGEQGSFVRLMRPFFTRKGCLKCHISQGYQVDALQGGIGVSVPMEPYLESERHAIRSQQLGHALLWILGMAALGVTLQRGKRRTLALMDAEKQLKDYSEHLEEKVEQRTAELLEVNTQLQQKILERRQAEKHLDSIWNRLQYLVASGPAVIYTCRASGDYGATYISENVRFQLGYEAWEFLESSTFWRDHIHPEDAQRVLAGLPHLFERGEHVHEYRFLHKNGTYRWMHDKLQLVRDTGGTPKEILGSWLDITERRQAEEVLLQLKKAVETMQLGVTVTDLKGSILYVNSADLKMHGYEKDDLLGRDVGIFAPSEYRKPLQLSQLKEKSSWLRESINVRKNGEQFPVQLMSDVVRDSEGVPMAIVTTCEDITERKRTERELQHAKEAAESANRAKSEFLANMSHEIRTPMNAILGFADVLASQVSDERHKNYLDAIRSGGRNLLTLINDVLDLSKIDAGKLELHYEPVELADVFEEIRHIFSLQLSKKQIAFSTSISEEVPQALQLDEVRLRQILFNLVGNAVKFTERGNITLSASAAPSSASTEECLSSSPPERERYFPSGRCPEPADKRGNGLVNRSEGAETLAPPSSQKAGLLRSRDDALRRSRTSSTLRVEWTQSVRDGVPTQSAGTSPPPHTPNVVDLRKNSPPSPLSYEERGSMMNSRDAAVSSPSLSKRGGQGVSLPEDPSALKSTVLPPPPSDNVVDLKKNSPPSPLSYEERGSTMNSRDAAVSSPSLSKRGGQGVSLPEEPSALKSTVLLPSKEGSLTEELRKEEEGCIDLTITVKDSGIGIPEGVQAQIFDAFRQQDGRDSRKHGGTGLGLTITKRLTEMMNGTLSLDSEVNEGSLFTLTFHHVSVAAPRQKSKARPMFSAEELLFAPAKILIVDDLENNRTLLNAYFQEIEHIHLLEAENGAQAIFLAEQHQPDLILMDIRMPIMDGYEATKRLKEQQRLQHIPVIALTAFAMKQDQERLMANGGFDGYLMKPVKRDELFHELARFLKHSTRQSAESAPLNASFGNADRATAPLSPETADNSTELIERLTHDITPLWENVRKQAMFHEIERFAIQMTRLGEHYSSKTVEQFGHGLLQHVRDFDVDRIESDLNAYPDLLDTLKKRREKDAEEEKR